MRFAFIAKHRGIWPVSWICEALGVSRSGFHAWLVRAPSARSRSDEEVVDLRYRIDAEDRCGEVVHSLPFKDAFAVIPEAA